MQAEILIPTSNMSEAEWLEHRQKGIGGSDAGAIAGLSKWKSPIGVYLDKIGKSPSESNSSEAAYFGHVLEDVVAQEFSKRTGLKVRKRQAILQHLKHSFMLANVDRLIIGKKEGLECKTASEYLKGDWEEEEIPAQYLIQCQHYMAVTGYEAWWIAVLIGGNKFVHKKIERDEEIINYLIEIESDFWNNHVLKKNPPAFDGSEASTNLLKAMYPEGDVSLEPVELAPEATDLISNYEQAKVEEKEASERRKEAENKLKSLLGEREAAYASDRLVTWKTISSSRVNSKLLKEKYPEVYEEVASSSLSRRFGIK
ncbi:YqaJ viral recombinase family protein [Priestia megaterium]|uniref:YqaJ viral recombinase family nuclease n=1 Tax=Priestia megaterium TaxID=1404 RepID=UPI002731F2D4|nr:YqaJ viral recombinase family protein [Priestia megaterium]MDP1441936.1 YqaJ viral recombinase family protein [Priestia megaterium]MDP1470999.1 YqaJ viral recombinase family protein [Priestia megaterium]